MDIYFGIIGKSFAGKETVYNIIKELIETYAHGLQVSIHRFSDPLNEILDITLQPRERSNQQKLSTALRRIFGEELLGNIIMERARKDTAKIVCLDGIRHPQDVIKLRDLPNSSLIFIYTSLEKRFERGQARADRPAQTWLQFVLEQSAEAESKIDEIARTADIILNNSGGIDELKAQILEKIIVRKLGIKISKEWK